MKCTAENQVKAGTAGAIEAVVKVINIHIGNVDVCKQACNIIDILIPDEGKALFIDKRKN